VRYGVAHGIGDALLLGAGVAVCLGHDLAQRERLGERLRVGDDVGLGQLERIALSVGVLVRLDDSDNDAVAVCVVVRLGVALRHGVAVSL